MIKWTLLIGGAFFLASDAAAVSDADVEKAKQDIAEYERLKALSEAETKESLKKQDLRRYDAEAKKVGEEEEDSILKERSIGRRHQPLKQGSSYLKSRERRPASALGVGPFSNGGRTGTKFGR